jgi:hypothetical protein
MRVRENINFLNILLAMVSLLAADCSLLGNEVNSVEIMGLKWQALTGKALPEISTTYIYKSKESFIINNGAQVAVHRLSSAKRGTVEIYLYDDPNTFTGSALANVYDGSTCCMVGIRPVDANNSKYVYCLGDGWGSTGIKRTTGWHQLKWVFDKKIGTWLYVDDKLVAKTREPRVFDRIEVGHWWHEGKQNATYVSGIKVTAKEDAEMLFGADELADISFDRSKPVVVGENCIDLNFSNEFTVRIVKREDQIAGIQAVAAKRDILWREPVNSLTLPVFLNQEGEIPYSCYRFIDAAQQGENFIIVIDLERPGTKPDRLEWIFKPEEIKSAGVHLAGFSYGYKFKSSETDVYKVVEDSAWRLNSKSPHDSEYFGASLNGPTEIDGGLQERNTTRIPFDYLLLPSGAMISFYEPMGIVWSKMGKIRNEETFSFHNEIVLGRQREFMTPKKVVLFYASPPEGINGWTKVWDILAERVQKAVGLKSILPLTTIDAGVGELVDRMYTNNPMTWKEMADKVIPYAESLGYQAIWIGGIWNFTFNPELRGQDGVINYGITEKFGGEKELKYLCDKAHTAGLKVIAWFPCGHLYKDSPLLQEHPDWLVKKNDGTAYGWGYPHLVCGSFRTGYKEYALSKLRYIREKTGLDGLWLDSMPWSAYTVINYAEQNPSPQVAEFVDFLKKLQEMGYAYIAFEGMGQFILSGHGALSKNWFVQESDLRSIPAEEYMFKSNFMTVQDNREKLYEELDYYKFLANKAPLVYYSTDIRNKEKLLSIITQANNDYRKSLPAMVQRNVLPDGKGVEWRNNENKDIAFFSYKSSGYKAVDAKEVLDVTTGRQVVLDANGVFMADPYHTYWIKTQSDITMLRN